MHPLDVRSIPGRSGYKVIDEGGKDGNEDQQKKPRSPTVNAFEKGTLDEHSHEKAEHHYEQDTSRRDPDEDARFRSPNQRLQGRSWQHIHGTD
jgi:hypothetical protein